MAALVRDLVRDLVLDLVRDLVLDLVRDELDCLIHIWEETSSIVSYIADLGP